MKQSSKRSRGVILTLQGWDKLQAAIAQVELSENTGDCFTLDELSTALHKFVAN